MILIIGLLTHKSKTKTMKNKGFYPKCCRIIWFLMLAVIVMSVIHGAMLYKYFEVYPQKEYVIDRYNPELPDEALTKIRMMNTLRLDLGIGLFLLVLFFYCDYKASPEDHLLKGLVEFIKKFKIEGE